jgi:hypothetical protein
MTSHLSMLVLFAIFVSAVFAALMRDDPRAQLRTATYLFAAFVGVALVLSWLMYPMPF